MPDEADALLRLAMVPGLGPVTVGRLLAAVESAAAIFHLGMNRLQAIDGLGPKRARLLCDPRGWDHVADERARCAAAGIRILLRGEDDYPRFFEKLTDPPLAIWLRGRLERRDELALAVVGPRRPSAYGHRQAERFSRSLAELGVTIVSGLARGVDTVAHQAALQAGGRTLAVLGSGFGRLYPSENKDLAERIVADHGALLSEYPYDTKPSPGTFPRRNRLVAALGLGTLVVEAGNRSGALITARLTGELGQEILVIPGPIDRPEHVGAHGLIRDGATLVTSIEDVLEEIPPLKTLAAGEQVNGKRGGPAPALNDRERQVYTLLSDDPRSVDDLIAVSRLPASAVSATLIALEIRRLARRSPAGYVRAL